ncbi:hypothetical protein R3P38DRAFT_3032125, partial [Favolaschia claudopus]
MHCTACHIIPHSKGDEYIKLLSLYRGITPPITEIRDVRNGILLYAGFHIALGAGQIAFLLTGAKNPYLDVSDVPGCQDSTAPHRLILQHIETLGPPYDTIARNNTDARFASASNGPKPELLHFFYACAVIRRWGLDVKATQHPLR